MGHRFTVMTVIDERGRRIPGSGYVPNRHDVLTGSQPDGTAFSAGEDMTCGSWTSSSDGKARIGHHDRAAWNSAHDSRGCSQEQLRASGGDGSPSGERVRLLRLRDNHRRVWRSKGSGL